MLMTLRPYQQELIGKIRDAYRSGYRAPLVVLPTGGGKTLVFCCISEMVAAKGKRTNTLVHRQELLNQTSEKLEILGVSHGLIAPGRTMTRDLVQVSSVQTLIRRLDKTAQPDLIVVDEAHHAQAGTWAKILKAWDKSRILGVTATPIRLDGKGLGSQAGGFFDCLIEGPNIRQLIEMGYLVQPIIYAPPTGIDLSGIHIRGGDYDTKELQESLDKKKITGCAIEHYRRLCAGAPAIAFCASVKHAEHVAEQFNGAGISAASLTGDLADGARKYRIAGLASGAFKVLTSCDIINEGTDIPVVTAGILLRPTCSLGLYLQQVGRVLRVHPNKTNAIILDHVGNCLKHGLPDDVRSWSLDGTKQKKKKADENSAAMRIRQCAKCYAVFTIGMTHCPQCGYAVNFSDRQCKQVEGDLVKITSEQIVAAQKVKKIEEGKAETLQDFLDIAKQRGYNPNWAYIRYNLRQSRRSRIAA